MAETYIDGFFFEYDDSASIKGSSKSIQYFIKTDLANEPITTDFFKAHANIEIDLDDVLCNSYIKAARQELEKFSQLSFGDKTMLLKAKELPVEYNLLYGPINEIVTPQNTYTVLGSIITSEEVQKDITIEYTTTWGTPGLPEPIKIAIAQTAAGFYYHRENILADVNGSQLVNQAKKAIQHYRNIHFV